QTSTQDPNAANCAHYNYTITRTWTAHDACNNTSNQSQVITVSDNTAPQLIGVPPDTTASCQSVPTPAPSPTASDNCDPNPTVTYNQTSTQDPNAANCAHYNYTLTRT